MNLTHDLIAVFGGIFGLLAVFSAIGAVLKYRISPGAPHGVIDNLNARIKAWWAMIALIGGAIWIGKWGVIGLFGFISFQSLREFVSLTHTRRGDHRALIWSFFVFLPLQYYLIAIDWYGLFSILIPVYAFLLLPISSSLGADTTRFLERAAKVQWGLMICVYCLSHVPALLTLQIAGYEGRNALLVVFLVLTVQSSDVFQYVWGKLLGKHKVSPAISPSKTVEGLVGGVLTSTAVGAALWWITPFSPLEAGLIALVINMMGFFGGFVLSAIKRDRGVKDWGAMIEGHGGMLDRVDSISFSAPIFFHIVRYWWVA
ncbi:MULTISPECIES: phosphatidate cytidylyltransferase [Zoogloea]|jgi:phosphatidate cytidylyltransferase|uniref:Phosphatidate cytidylyltransferase n=1 Tax=Zoogloea oleivorans TaxID=1552750 RepID=A0A6C2D102_9RHOO|nr:MULTISPECIES: phosphatidate cytidylyltransferase [Zoogloea]MDD2668185.1 phosphatidate cytidylyltransferase [Zoogloea sp.]MDY0036759.1 phosphatidate cytidylyltransferase [Zoogloea oleivorans]TYC60180.1 phosphatidate cytidylyltransferase [Zoogloea oleivorans]